MAPGCWDLLPGCAEVDSQLDLGRRPYFFMYLSPEELHGNAATNSGEPPGLDAVA